MLLSRGKRTHSAALVFIISVHHHFTPHHPLCLETRSYKSHQTQPKSWNEARTTSSELTHRSSAYVARHPRRFIPWLFVPTSAKTGQSFGMSYGLVSQQRGEELTNLSRLKYSQRNFLGSAEISEFSPMQVHSDCGHRLTDFDSIAAETVTLLTDPGTP